MKTIKELKEGDCVLVHGLSWDGKERIYEPYQAIILWKGLNNQPLITKIDEYKPHWSTYEDIVEVIGHVDLENLFNRIYPNIMKPQIHQN